MTDSNNDQLIQDGLLLLDRALSHFNEVKGCDNSSTMAKIIHNAILLAETFYAIKK